jgi:multidrug efflux pump subunit AcrB
VKTKNGPGALSWGTLTSAGVLLVGVLALAGTLVQNQINTVALTLQAEKQDRKDSEKQLHDLLQAELDRRLSDLSKRIDAVQDEQVRRRGEFITIHIFAEFEKRVNDIKDQVKTLEATRPTTGELQAIGSSNKDQITKLETRVGSLEDNLRSVARTPRRLEP